VKTVIHWFRRDLRLADNTSLSQAAKRAQTVVPVFILEDASRTGPDVGAARLAFLLQSVAALRQNLAARGQPLVIRCGRAEEILPGLCREVGAQAVFANRRYEPQAQCRDERLAAALLQIGVGFEVFKDTVAWDEQEILTQAGRTYTVFTPYAKAWKARPMPRPRPAFVPKKSSAPAPRSDSLPAAPDGLGQSLTQALPPAGEAAAREELRRFLAGPVHAYASNRDFPALAGTSHLSPHLHAGTIGIRTVLAALKKARECAAPAQAAGCDVFLNELIWREFYVQVLCNFPHVATGAFRPELNRLPWSENQDHFEAWTAGRTGYPIVDAAMRCLHATGSLHNRLRMIVAMFLTKDLLLSWQWGERWFMRQLVDGDLAANNGGWQWSAGTGTDAAPYFRIFNPVTQAQKFDPAGAFVRRWVPELENFPDDLVHQPWENPSELARSKYPARIVRHEEQRERCLAMFKAVKR
jgi:deoxyribodipyrimidine photo-lyase